MAEQRDKKGGDRQQDRRGSNGERSRSSEKLDEMLEELQQFRTQLAGMTNVSDRERTLQDDNYRVRRQNAKLKEQLEQAQDAAGEVPDGSVVMKKEDADELEAFRAFKLKPAELKTALDERTALQSDKVQRENAELHADAADALDYPNVAALSKELSRSKLIVSMKPVRVDDPENPGKKILKSMPFVKPQDKADAQEEALDDYIAREWSHLETVFMSEPEEGDEEGGETEHTAATGGERRRDARPTAPASRKTGNGIGGVPVPAMRKMGTPNVGARTERADQEAAAKKRQSGIYSL